MDVLTALRVSSGKRRGSSRPVVVETEAGPRFVKLRGAAQGTGPLVAEIIVGAFADAIGLSVPARSLVYLPDAIDVTDGDDELEDLLRASVGLNLGFGYLVDARDATPREVEVMNADDRAAILWLDRFVLNPDRTVQNPNLVYSDRRIWLVDHGAALGFQYDWSLVTEETPRAVRPEAEPHLFASSVAETDLAEWDEILAARLTRDVIESAVAAVPDTFLVPMLSPSPSPPEAAEALRGLRAAYVAFLWKRLAPPRSFLAAGPPMARSRGRGRPAWLTRRSG
jgi:hypothetical protein